MGRITVGVVVAVVSLLVLSTISSGERRTGEVVEVTSLEQLTGNRTASLRIGDDVRIVQVGRIPLAQAYETVEGHMRLMEAAILLVTQEDMWAAEKTLNETGDGFALEIGTRGVLIESFGPHQAGTFDFVYVKLRLLDGRHAGKELWLNKKNVAKVER